MDLNETIQSAANSILANRLRSFLTMLGIVIGVTSVILLISLVSGLKTFITEQIQSLGSNLIYVIPGQIGGSRSPGGIQVNRLTQNHARDLKKKLEPIAEVTPVIQKVSSVKYLGKTIAGTTTFGVEANYPKLISIRIDKGRFINQSEAASNKKVAVIGPTVVEKLFGNQSPLDKTITIGTFKYRVIGITATRSSIFGIDQDNSVFIPLASASRQFGIENLNTIFISANSPELISPARNKAEQTLKKRLQEDDFSVLTQEQTLETVSRITSVLSLALGGIAAISLVVGGVGITNIMLVTVTERTREIGLRKALGAKNTDIRNQFLVEALALSAIGGTIGIVLGVSISLLVNHFITTTITWWSLVLSFGVSMLVGIIFGVAPAIRAARLTPIEALRHE